MLKGRVARREKYVRTFERGCKMWFKNEAVNFAWFLVVVDA